MWLCGKRSSRCYALRTRLAMQSSFAALVILTRFSKSASLMTSCASAPRVGAWRHVPSAGVRLSVPSEMSFRSDACGFQMREALPRRYVPCDHPCQKPICGEDCGKCMVPTDNVALPCGHIKNNVACHRTLDLGSIHCDVIVPKEVPGCKHTVDIKCAVDVAKDSFKCTSPCATILSCGHRCSGSCGRCNFKDEAGQAVIKHQDCTVTCGRKYSTCNHNCPRKCHSGTDCGPCRRPCEVSLSLNRHFHPLIALLGTLQAFSLRPAVP
jgi:hypothetical protein